MDAQEMDDAVIEAELWARELLREFDESWNVAAPIVIGEEPEEVEDGLES